MSAKPNTNRKSWGHRLERIPENERPKIPEEQPRSARWATCSIGRCPRVYAWWGFYAYVTGKAGRVTNRRVHLCAYHARRFAEAHGLKWNPGD